MMLTARTDASSRAQGLAAGADDYLGKPFALSELRARLRTLLRRGSDPLRAKSSTHGALALDFDRSEARLEGHELPLTRREMQVLERLAGAQGQAVSREALLEEIWGESSLETGASLDVTLARLARKLDRGNGETLIQTIGGCGYALAAGPGTKTQ